jgi:hypothetical protein
MGTTYFLVNHTRREYVDYAHVGASSKREIAGNGIAASVSVWYLLGHRTDAVAFCSDQDPWPFKDGDWHDLDQYDEVTDRVVAELIDAQILEDHGRQVFSEDEPDVYLRKLRNIWMEDPRGHL